jgi:hypothetical protein
MPPPPEMMGGDPAGGLDPAAFGGMPDAGGMMPPGMGGPPPGGAAAPPPESGPIARPIDQLAELLADAKAKDLVMIDGFYKAADRIWAAYGGDPETRAPSPGKVGERDESYQEKSDEDRLEESDDTNDERWRRLQRGKSIHDVTGGYENLLTTLKEMQTGLVVKVRPKTVDEQMKVDGTTPAEKQASRLDRLIRLARRYDAMGEWERADLIDGEILRITRSEIP